MNLAVDCYHKVCLQMQLIAFVTCSATIKDHPRFFSFHNTLYRDHGAVISRLRPPRNLESANERKMTISRSQFEISRSPLTQYPNPKFSWSILIHDFFFCSNASEFLKLLSE